MKKTLCFVLGIIILVLVCGCSDESNDDEKDEKIKSWEDKIQISTLQYDNNNHIVGKMKNLTKKFYDVTLKVEAKSGSLVENITCYELLRPNESVDLSCLTYDLNETYSLKIDKVTLKEKEIPKLEEGKLEVDTLEYYFPDIYEAYALNMVPFYSFYDLEYPAITDIEYNDSKIKIEVSNQEKLNGTTFYFDYDTENNELSSLHIFINKKDADSTFIENIIKNITRMNFIHRNCDLELVEKSLKRKDLKSDECVFNNHWCVSADYNDSNFIFFGFSYRD